MIFILIFDNTFRTTASKKIKAKENVYEGKQFIWPKQEDKLQTNKQTETTTSVRHNKSSRSSSSIVSNNK